MILPVILAGGSGSRLWPLSRELYPKQFLNIAGEQSMLQQTLQRLQGLEDYLTDSKCAAPFIICNEEHRFIAAEQARSANIQHSGILLEPVGRNTAPAIALAALQALGKSTNNEQDASDPILLVLAADHHIANTSEFQQVISRGVDYAKQGKLVTFGITPNAPETGYGYIKQGKPLSPLVQTDTNAKEQPTHHAYAIDCFVEKPDKATAEEYISSEQYLWNSGMFMFKASRYLEELSQHHPEILAACQLALSKQNTDLDFIRIDAEAFKNSPSDSIDYAVMEKTSHAAVIPMDVGWNDIGSWSAIWDVSDKDEHNNVIEGDVLTVDSQHNYIHAENKLVATVGVENLIIVETKDAILVANKDKVQGVKSIVSQLNQAGRTEHVHHREVFRPWGKYDVIDLGKRDKVKRITVKAGHQLSLQMHHHRAEHWVVVAGTAKVTNDEKTYLVEEDQSTYIPLGHIHSLENPGDSPLEMIEVQTGSHLSEDDIIRYQDSYGRDVRNQQADSSQNNKSK
ncbi:mannose-1-phosphate guanylyltransferase/mannose-6-phosphate isomerase [Vibrio lentus]|uniref:mannose-1-phosphate guanylyltransferase n=1 Tax=Vibrio lentus TaxID=136468 RepID=A0AB36XRX9_9VIBR|nr:mannose-1-phosphate guanylyltransferase/mannose-6-phosphate isomerase [Vibrio lentus]MCC4838962.1 mannose-1-phosphate guanylyltransferase/mannose-6-phosphate isomerase [Vibrio lentus]PMI11260.1 mannose-1-phosphate guanylyltransferase/mannose-6-phosphate isomerase [Vibrio lentus]PMK37752.1 mannose-1-phosphate guanylyltransferase/mannose-6-phosphate isomerase [Vibrio lentus]PMK49263.1 mannose-1-phosphate guanylyltransferase/mannose-6-phosphate isomerase [Vibrio lentus]PML32493.1 mannose-1-pho